MLHNIMMPSMLHPCFLFYLHLTESLISCSSNFFAAHSIEKVIPEYGGADKESVPYIGKFIKMNAKEFLKKFDGMSGEEIAAARYKRFREM